MPTTFPDRGFLEVALLIMTPIMFKKHRYAVLFTGSPPSAQAKLGDVVEDFTSWMLRHMTKLLQRDNFVRNLPLLVSDTSAMLDDIVRRGHGGGDEPTTGIFDPFDDMYKIVYQMTMRTLGCNEVADDLPLLWKTLALFEEIEHGSGPTKIIFPWIPTVGSLRQTIAGARLYAIFSEVAKKRKAEGRRENDTFQYLMDTGVDMVYVLSVSLRATYRVMSLVISSITSASSGRAADPGQPVPLGQYKKFEKHVDVSSQFIVAGIFAGLLNSGINAAWLLAFLANNPEWYRRVQAEVDASVAKHRKSPSQTPSEVLATLTLDDWESEFPSIDLGLRESIRISMVGTAFRRNIGGGAVPIGGGTGEIIPRDAVALYMPDEVHMDPAVYANPAEFDPGRFLPGRAEDKAVPLAYLGWGAGRHPCLGVRFAKLEMGITTAMFAARFDWALVDGEGNPTRELPPVDRQKFAAHKPDEPIRLRYTERQY